jgi:hypothetical protein
MNTCAYHPGVPAVAYCRTCGKPLCEECKREVRGVVYCEACIAARLEGTAPPPSYAGGPSSAHTPGAPNPTLAAILGVIPGVGAFYNGQYQKGVIHVLMFVAIIFMTSEISDAFGFLFPFYFFYMMWDAYVTAKSRITGEKVPDPLGINNLFGAEAPAPAANATATAPPAASAAAAAAAPSGATNAGAAHPSQAFGPADYRDLRRAGRDGYRNGPIGAFILIGLGVLFLLGDISKHFVHNFWPVILIVIGVWKGIQVWNVREQ